MDELLALMEEPPPQDEEAHLAEEDEQGEEDGGLGELSSLLDVESTSADTRPVDPLDTSVPRRQSSSSNNPSTNSPPLYQRRSVLVTPSYRDDSTRLRHPTRPSSERPSNSSSAKPVDIGLDDKLGIRMINRRISSVDLIDLISTSPHFTPATLSAMSLQRLSTLLIDPPRIIDRATVAGKTNLVTVGVVFSNTGTRFSKKGSAFCVITIGNFVSGPCVTVMLFGDAYSNHCKTLNPGKVVALVAPRLMPPKNDGSEDTSISFSVTDATQLQLVATAKDYGVCKATGVRVKQPNGQWTNTGKCRNFVDLRVCEFCQQHRKQKHTTSNMRVAGNSSTTTRSNNNGGGRMQKLREEHRQVAPPQDRFKRQQQVGPAQRPSGSSMHTSAAINNWGEGSGLRKNQNVSMHMKRENPTARNNRGSFHSNSSNRLLNGQGRPPKTSSTLQSNKRPASSTTAPPSTAPKKKKLGIVGIGDVLNMASKKKQPLASRMAKSSQTKKRINTTCGGFDGSVPVPKPNRLFQNRNANGAPKEMVRNKPSPAEDSQEPPKENILQKQSDLARQLREKQHHGKKTKDTLATTRSTRNSFLDTIDTKDMEKAASAKSRFQAEADAEEYAKKRSALVELERVEASKNPQGKNNYKENSARIQKEWFCATCNVRYSQKPVRCCRQNHQVKTLRELSKVATKSEQRFKLHRKDAADGGLQLAKGLDWSAFRNSRFS